MDLKVHEKHKDTFREHKLDNSPVAFAADLAGLDMSDFRSLCSILDILDHLIV